MFAYRSPTQWWTSLMRPSNWDVKEQQCIRVLRPKRCAHPHIHLWAGENSLKAGFPGYFSSVTNKKENDFYKNIKGRGKKGSQNQELLMISSNETHWVKHLVLIFSHCVWRHLQSYLSHSLTIIDGCTREQAPSLFLYCNGVTWDPQLFPCSHYRDINQSTLNEMLALYPYCRQANRESTVGCPLKKDTFANTHSFWISTRQSLSNYVHVFLKM